MVSDGVSTNVPPDKTKRSFHPTGCLCADRIAARRRRPYVYQLLRETPVHRSPYQMHRKPSIKINKFGDPERVRIHTPVIVTGGSIRLSYGTSIISLCQNQSQPFTQTGAGITEIWKTGERVNTILMTYRAPDCTKKDFIRTRAVPISYRNVENAVRYG